jgi:hypothetical protein
LLTRFLHSLVLLLLGLVVTPVLAWGNHSAASYRAFEKMPEVANASIVTVEPLEAFLRAEEYTVDALLASQEAWARANLENYPTRPAALAFAADPARPDEPRRLAFLGALRVAPNSRFALYSAPDPWNPAIGTPLPHGAVNTLPETAPGADKFLALKPGDQVTALTVLASATDEPDYGLDINLWDDSPSDWGKTYGFGPQPFGNPALGFSSQAPFHMGFMHESRLLYLAAPFIKRTFPLLRSHQFSTLAALAFRTGHAYWGWRFAGLSLHYLQDLTQPYHASLAPGESSLKLLGVNALDMAGLAGLKNDLVALLSNRHLALEKYQSEWLQLAAANRHESALEKALRATDKDKSYPEWTARYLRDVVSLQAYRSAPAVARALVSALPATYVSDPGFDFGNHEAGISLWQEASKRDASTHARLDAALVELSENFGAHSRNALRGILRASSSP